MTKKQYWVLTGGTGTGKSSLGIRLAQHLNCGILSMDSMLVYRGLDIGTAKPNAEELKAVPHHLIDVVEPHQDYNVSEHLRACDEIYEKHQGRMIGVGGTPFYIKVLRDGLSEIETIPNLEAHLSTWKEQILRQALLRLDPERAKAILPNDTFRLARALTLIFSCGVRATELKRNEPRPDVSVDIVALRCDRAHMHQVMEQRIENMFQQGLLEEARHWFERGPLSKTAAAAVGYKELFAHFRGESSLEHAKFKILVGTRRLFKHQMTWLSKMDVTWVDADPYQPELAWPKIRELGERHFQG
jgi:tRNA dimethylallyltransferase